VEVTANQLNKQEAQLSQRDRAILRLTEYFANHSRSLKITLLSRA